MALLRSVSQSNVADVPVAQQVRRRARLSRAKRLRAAIAEAIAGMVIRIELWAKRRRPPPIV